MSHAQKVKFTRLGRGVTYIMKYLLLLAFTAIGSFCYAQFPSKDGLTIYVDTVVKVDSISKSKLFTAAKLWTAEYFKSSKAVVELSDADAGVIYGDGNANIYIPSWTGTPFATRCYFSFKIQVKDGRYKLELFDFYYKPDKGLYLNNHYTEPTTTYPKDWFMPTVGKQFPKIATGYRDETRRVLDSIFETLKTKMTSDILGGSDW